MHESEDAEDEKFIVQQFMWPVALDPENAVHDNVRVEWHALLQAAAAPPLGGAEGASKGNAVRYRYRDRVT